MKEIRYYRQMGAQLVPWVLRLDDEDKMVEHKPDSEVAQGYQIKLEKTIKVRRPTAEELQEQDAIARRFINSEEPCWFPGCEELREEMHAELARPDCLGCEQPKIQRRYVRRALDILKPKT